MSIIHSNGFITLPNGKTLPCTDFKVDIEESVPPVSEEERRQVNEALRRTRGMQGVRIDFATNYEDGGAYQPTGPVVDSTLAGKGEEER